MRRIVAVLGVVAIVVLAGSAIFASPPQQLQVGNSDSDPAWAGDKSPTDIANWNSPTSTTGGALWIDTGSGPVQYDSPASPINVDVNVQLMVQAPAPYGWTNVATLLTSIPSGQSGSAYGDITYWYPEPGCFYAGNVFNVPGTDSNGGPVFNTFNMELYVWTGNYNTYAAALAAAEAHTVGVYVADSGIFNQSVSTSPLEVPHDLTDMPATILRVLLPGDANGDGRVDINDLTIVLTNYGQSGMVWSQGDFNTDTQVDINDLTIVLTNYGQTASAAGIKAVPEPSSLVLLGVAAIGLLACCWRRRG